MTGDDLDDLDEGPFCEHYMADCSCDVLCTNCGHRCGDHYLSYPRECMGPQTEDLPKPECECPGFKE